MNVRCNMCYGGKEVLGKGLFYISCPKCAGVGYVVEDDKQLNEVPKKDIEAPSIEPVFKKKKAGRPKKIDKE